LGLDQFACGLFTAAATAGHRKVRLNLIEGCSAAIHNFANLSVADAMTNTDVHIKAAGSKVPTSEYK
jgi:hypothetical protein